MKRKLMLMFLAALLAVGLLGTGVRAARADDTVYTEGTLYYTVSNGSITITGCFGRDAEVRVPAMIAGIPVNTIASGAFANNEFVKVVYLPDTISRVGSGAFADGIRVVYNANTDHPQDTPTDLILGLLTPASDPPAPTDPPAEPTPAEPAPTEPPAAPTATTAQATPSAITGSGSAEFPGGTVGSGTEDLPTATPKATAKTTAKATAKATPKATEAPTEEPLPSIDVGPIGEVTENGTVIAEVEVEFGDDPDATPAPTEAPVTEAPVTEAPKVAEAKTTDAPAKAAPTAEPTAEPAPAATGGSAAWVWIAVAAAALIAAVLLLRKKKK